MKRLLLALGGSAALLLAVMALRAAGLESRQPPAGDPYPIELDPAAITERFSRAITYPTVSPQTEEERDVEAFLAFHRFLEESFPSVHRTLTRETVSEMSLLYTWAGQRPELDPVLLMGHIDVVPVVPGTEGQWREPPFSGVVAEGTIWGRGAIDDKASVMAILEAVEYLTARGHRPERTIYLAFGHDEEVGGELGAGRIAALLRSRGAEPFALVLDEGGLIADGLVPGVDGKVAIIGIAEKGFVSLELTVAGGGGHSSTPPDETNLGILARAVRRLEENQFPARLGGATREMLEWLAPEASFGRRMLLGNLWLTAPLIERGLLSGRTSAPMVRTTTATTILAGGVKENVLATEGRAVVNFRILSGETRESVAERARRVIDDPRVALKALPRGTDPSPVSDPGSDAFRLVASSVRSVFGEEVLVAPYLVLGGTDAKYYAGGSNAVFRFLPIVAGREVVGMAHGTNERLTVDGLMGAIRYFAQLIRDTDRLP